MNNLFLILKNEMMNSFQINKLLNPSSKAERNKTLGMGLLCISSVVLILFSLFEMFNEIGNMLQVSNQLDLLLYLGVIGAVFSTIFTGIYKVPSYLISSKDYDLLLALPISHKTILSSKLIHLIIINYLFSGCFLFPPAIVYFIKTNASFVFIINLIILFMFVSVIPIIIASIVAFILGKITSKLKYKNHMFTILNLAFVILIVYFSYNTQDMMINIASKSDSIIDIVKKIYLPAYYFVDSLVNHNFISLLIFVIMSTLAFIIFVEIFAKQFTNINSSMNESYKKDNYKIKSLRQDSVFKALLNKEIKRYLSSSLYVLNTAIGMVFLFILAIGASLFGGDKIAAMLEIPNIGDTLFVYILAIGAMCTVMSCTTNSSISIEGKNLWILKSSPVDEGDIFNAKIGLNLLITLPCIIISSILISVSFEFGMNKMMHIMLLLSSYAVFVSVIGLLINLKLPKLDWTNEVIVIKQSMSVLLSILIGFVSLIIPIALFIKLEIDNILSFVILTSVALLVLSTIIYRYTLINGKKIFKNL